MKYFFLALLIMLTACEPSKERISEPLEISDLRLVTLAPHLAELVVSAGAEQFLVGVSAYSDFPKSVASLPVVSDGFRIDAEALLAARPTLVLAWGGGGQQSSLTLLDELGIPYEVIDAQRLDDIAPAIRKIGEIAGTESIAQAASFEFEKALTRLTYEGESVSVFYQIGSAPLYTVNHDHYISDVIALCGGNNIFAEIKTRVPVVSLESVVIRNPDVILGVENGSEEKNIWADFQTMTVNNADTSLPLPADIVSRPSTRLAAGAVAVCEALAIARDRLGRD